MCPCAYLLALAFDEKYRFCLKNNKMKISSRLADLELTGNERHSWEVNTTCQVSLAKELSIVVNTNITEIKQRLSRSLSHSFSIDHLAKVAVPEMGFPWRVPEHQENGNEMLAKVHADPEADSSKHWGSNSWASVLDAATSISSSIFHADPLLRMPTAIERMTISTKLTPKICYIHIKKALGEHAVDVLISDEAGTILVDIQNLKVAGIEGDLAAKKQDKGLVHRTAWPSVQLAENALHLHNVLFISNESSLLRSYRSQLSSIKIDFSIVAEPKEIGHVQEGSVIILIAEDVYALSAKSCEKL